MRNPFQRTAVSVVLLFYFLMGICSISVSSAGKGTITLSNAEGKPGKDVTVTIELSDNPGFISANLYISYDSKVLKLKEVADGGLLDGVSHSNELTNPYSLAWINDLATENTTVNGTLVTLTFTIIGNTDVITKVNAEQDIIDAQLHSVVFDIIPASITIKGDKPAAKQDNNPSDHSKSSLETSPETFTSGNDPNNDEKASDTGSGGNDPPGSEKTVQTDAGEDKPDKETRSVEKETGDIALTDRINGKGLKTDDASDETKDQQNGSGSVPWIITAAIAAAGVITAVLVYSYRRKKVKSAEESDKTELSDNSKITNQTSETSAEKEAAATIKEGNRE